MHEVNTDLLLIGARLACLVNASVTVCGDNAIYAFGGFDQYTDEGMHFLY